ncbi:hypothetical protein AN221_27375 [Streptomyces nanshensis]|uniref:Uncharacterized protein n=1 Tax=Streptomyces nanshensis TaxID=518642 RepID=A0A1E7LM10_9ACTN|nr:hypothetical protein AN221_27375 [Streptomyces nanshensis]
MGSPGSRTIRSSSPVTTNTAPAASASSAYGPYPSTTRDTTSVPDAIPGSHSFAAAPPTDLSSTPAARLSTTGPGTPWRPSSAQATAVSTGSGPTPPYASGTASANTPASAARRHRASPGAWPPAAHARTADGTSAAVSSASSERANSRCSSVRRNRISAVPSADRAAARR